MNYCGITICNNSVATKDLQENQELVTLGVYVN